MRSKESKEAALARSNPRCSNHVLKNEESRLQSTQLSSYPEQVNTKCPPIHFSAIRRDSAVFCRISNIKIGLFSLYNPVSMNEYDKEKWVAVYKAAVLELNRAAMTGRIGDARTEIAARLEKLKELPGLHEQEHVAILDAINNLRVLEREEAKLAANDKKRLLEEAAKKLQTIAPRFEE